LNIRSKGEEFGHLRFYHITFKDRINSIFKIGLVPAKDLKATGFDQPYPSDENFVYLFNTARIHKNLHQSGEGWLRDKVMLSVNLPVTHPLEREYDQAVISLRLTGDALKWFLNGRKQSSSVPIDTIDAYVHHYFQKVHGIDYSGRFTIGDVREFIDKNISDKQWAENDGCYRTRKPIPPDCLEILPIEKLNTP
jgi:hypothetical protein